MAQWNGTAFGSRCRLPEHRRLLPRLRCVRPIRCGQVPSTPFKGFVARPPDHSLNLINAWSLAHASRLAYTEPAECLEVAEGRWGLKDIKCYGHSKEGPDTQCFLASGPDYVVLAFRGTEFNNMRDWLRDVKYWKNPGGPFGCRVHAGFLEGLRGEWEGKSIIDWVTEDLKARQKKDGRKPIFVTGHSLGGALATLATAMLLEDEDLKDDIMGQYTFGSPRVGTQRFRECVHKETKAGIKIGHRFRNREDIVTRIPPVWRNYAHVGRWWYMSGDEQELILNPSFWTRLKDALNVKWDFVPDFVSDHTLSETAKEGQTSPAAGGYIEGLEKNLERMEGSYIDTQKTIAAA